MKNNLKHFVNHKKLVTKHYAQEERERIYLGG